MSVLLPIVVDRGERDQDDDTTDAAAKVPTVRDRLRNAQVSDSRIELHHEAEAIALDGEVVTDLDQTAPPGTRINFLGR